MLGYILVNNPDAPGATIVEVHSTETDEKGRVTYVGVKLGTGEATSHKHFEALTLHTLESAHAKNATWIDQ